MLFAAARRSPSAASRPWRSPGGGSSSAWTCGTRASTSWSPGAGRSATSLRQRAEPGAGPGLLTYPFVKLFALVRGLRLTGYVLYMRHLYLLHDDRGRGRGLSAAPPSRALGAGAAGRRGVRHVPPLGDAAAELQHHRAGLPHARRRAGRLGRGLGRGRRYALASGAAFGVAVVAYPSLLFIVPFFAVFLAFALGRRAVAHGVGGRVPASARSRRPADGARRPGAR